MFLLRILTLFVLLLLPSYQSDYPQWDKSHPGQAIAVWKNLPDRVYTYRFRFIYKRGELEKIQLKITKDEVKGQPPTLFTSCDFVKNKAVKNKAGWQCKYKWTSTLKGKKVTFVDLDLHTDNHKGAEGNMSLTGSLTYYLGPNLDQKNEYQGRLFYF